MKSQCFVHVAAMLLILGNVGIVEGSASQCFVYTATPSAGLCLGTTFTLKMCVENTTVQSVKTANQVQQLSAYTTQSCTLVFDAACKIYYPYAQVNTSELNQQIK